MAKPLKIVILIAALLLPVAVFVFLHAFGKNQFDIPIYYQTEQELDIEPCYAIEFPYALDMEKSAYSSLRLDKNKASIFIYLPQHNQNHIHQFVRVNKRVGKKIQLIVFTEKEIPVESNVLVVSANDAEDFWKCSLLSSNYNDWVLVDEKGSIRGYYQASEEEINRLIVESDILLKNREQ